MDAGGRTGVWENIEGGDEEDAIGEDVVATAKGEAKDRGAIVTFDVVRILGDVVRILGDAEGNGLVRCLFGVGPLKSCSGRLNDKSKLNSSEEYAELVELGESFGEA